MATPWTVDEYVVFEGADADCSAAEIECALFRKDDLAEGAVIFDAGLVQGSPAHQMISHATQLAHPFIDVKHELTGGMLELCPKGKWASVPEGQAAMLDMYQYVLHLGHATGIQVSFIADPVTCLDAEMINIDQMPDDERYRMIVKDWLPGAKWCATTCSTHNHNSNYRPLDAAYFQERDALVLLLMPILAAACNSYNPRMNLHSQRMARWQILPSLGPYQWSDASAWREDFEYAIQCGKAKGPQDIHPFVKPGKYTREIRECDVQSSARNAIALYAATVACEHYVRKMTREGGILGWVPDRHFVRHVRRGVVSALSYGVSDLSHKMANPFGVGSARMDDIFHELEQRIGPIMDQLDGTGWSRHWFFSHMVFGPRNGALIQQAWWHTYSSPLDVLKAEEEFIFSELDAAREVFPSVQSTPFSLAV